MAARCATYHNCIHCVRSPFEEHCDWNQEQNRCIYFYDHNSYSSVYDLIGKEWRCPLSHPPLPTPLPTPRPPPQSTPPPAPRPPPQRPQNPPILPLACLSYKSCTQCVEASIGSGCLWHEQEQRCILHSMISNQNIDLSQFIDGQGGSCRPHQEERPQKVESDVPEEKMQVSVIVAISVGAFFCVVCFLLCLIRWWNRRTRERRRNTRIKVHQNKVLRQRQRRRVRPRDHHEIEMSHSEGHALRQERPVDQPSEPTYR